MKIIRSARVREMGFSYSFCRRVAEQMSVNEPTGVKTEKGVIFGLRRSDPGVGDEVSFETLDDAVERRALQHAAVLKDSDYYFNTGEKAENKKEGGL